MRRKAEGNKGSLPGRKETDLRREASRSLVKKERKTKPGRSKAPVCLPEHSSGGGFVLFSTFTQLLLAASHQCLPAVYSHWGSSPFR